MATKYVCTMSRQALRRRSIDSHRAPSTCAVRQPMTRAVSGIGGKRGANRTPPGWSHESQTLLSPAEHLRITQWCEGLDDYVRRANPIRTTARITGFDDEREGRGW